MSCIHPLFIHRGQFTDVVPCGKCPACLKARQQLWYMRGVMESEYWVNHPLRQFRSPRFITLTYDDSHLPMTGVDYETGEEIPEYPTLRYDDVNKMWRTLKMHNKSLKREHVFSYMYVGEHGKKRQRPHYHVLAFGLDDEDYRFIKSWWLNHYCPQALDTMKDYEVRNGRPSYELGVVGMTVKPSQKDCTKVAKYVSKYTTKMQDEETLFSRPLAKKPRIYASRHYGYKDIERFAKLVNLPMYGKYNIKELELLSNRLVWSHGYVPQARKVVISKLPSQIIDKFIPKQYVTEVNYKVENPDDLPQNYFYSRVTTVRTVREIVTIDSETGETNECSLRSALSAYAEYASINEYLRIIAERTNNVTPYCPAWLDAFNQYSREIADRNTVLCQSMQRQFTEFASKSKDCQ